MCSDEFGPLGRAEAEVLGLPGLPLIAIPHPLAGNVAALVADKAAAVADEVLAALCGDAASIVTTHAARFTHLTERRLAGGAVCVDAVCAFDPAVSRAPGGAVR
ncbi:MAG: hypothetical protein AB7Q81_10490 [Gammaproteobacteria bacterium]